MRPQRRAAASTSIAQVRRVEKHGQLITAVSPNSMIRSILPDNFSCTLKYCSSKAYTTGAGGIVGATNTYQLNGLFDPDTTGVGHQPYGFDQITPFYAAYTVRRAWANITVTGVDDTSTYLAWMVQPTLSATVLAGSTLEQCSELDELNFFVLGQSTSGIPYQQIKLPLYDLPKLEGLSWPAYLGNPNENAAPTGNPSTGVKLVVGIGNAAGTAAKAATLTIEIFFDAYFHSRKSLPQS